MAHFTPRSSRRAGFGAPRRNGTSVGTLMTALAVVWIVVLLGTTARGVVKSVQLTQSLADLRKDSLEVATQLDSVKRVLASQNELAELERIAREKRGLARPGEIVYRKRYVTTSPDSAR